MELLYIPRKIIRYNKPTRRAGANARAQAARSKRRYNLMNANHKTRAISRRSFLKGVGAVGAAGMLAACGGSDSTAASGGSAAGGEAAAEGKVINI